MKRRYQNTKILILYIFLMLVSNFALAEQAIESFSPVLLEDLQQARGLGGIFDVTNNNELEAILTDNNASNNVTGDNIIDGSSFNDASGVFSIIQNTGNNVIIQDSTIITVIITPN